jgi:hypothetical protein
MVVFPLLEVLVLRTSLCVGDVAAGCGTIASTNNSTTTGSASQTPAGTTSVGEGTMEQRLARDQFSTREQVTMYNFHAIGTVQCGTACVSTKRHQVFSGLVSSSNPSAESRRISCIGLHFCSAFGCRC